MAPRQPRSARAAGAPPAQVPRDTMLSVIAVALHFVDDIATKAEAARVNAARNHEERVETLTIDCEAAAHCARHALAEMRDGRHDAAREWVERLARELEEAGFP